MLVFLAPAFFGGAAPWAIVALVGGNLVMLALVGVAVNKFVFKGERSAFIMEMPLYHRPNARTIGLYVWRNTWSFIKRAGTSDRHRLGPGLGSLHVPGGPRRQRPGGHRPLLRAPGSAHGARGLEADRGTFVEFRGQKNSVATLGVLFGSGMTGTVGAAGAGLAAKVATVLTPAAAAAFLVVQMTFIPCAATMAAIRHESRSWRWTGVSVALMLVVALVLGVVVYQVGSLF